MKKTAVATFMVLAIGIMGVGCGDYCEHCSGEECTLPEEGCSPEAEGGLAQVQHAIESSELTIAEAGLFAAAIDAYDGSQTENQMILQVQDRLEEYYQPADCTHPTLRAHNMLGIRLWDCTGPFGEKLNGDMTFIYEVKPDRLVVHVDAYMMELNGHVVTIESLTATYLDGEPLEVKARSTAVTSSGWIIGRAGHYDMTWDLQSGCLSIEGDWPTWVHNGDLFFKTDATGLEYCRDRCPLSGEVNLTKSGTPFTTVEFNGSDRVPWSTEDGSSGTVDLPCGR